MSDWTRDPDTMAYADQMAGSRASSNGAPPVPQPKRPPTMHRLDHFLATPDEDAKYRIDGLLPVGGRAVLAAQFKAGKSTLAGNLTRALADAAPFLGAFDVHPTGRTIAILDDELSTKTIRRWLREQGIRNQQQVYVIPIRGDLAAFDIRKPDCLAYWTEQFQQRDVGFLILDCLRPLLDSMGLSESNETGRFLVPYDQLLGDARIDESVLVQHMGHTNERARGDSRLRDWPDAEWKITRPPGQDDAGKDIDNPRAARYFSAYGRDVDIPERRLSYDPVTRHLNYSDQDRRESRVAGLVALVADLLAAEGESTTNEIVKGITGRRADVLAAIEHGVQNGRFTTRDGMNRTRLVQLANPP